MRSILKKLDRHEELNEHQYQQLMSYIDKLRMESFESYVIFQQRYAQTIWEEYSTYLPRFLYGWDELINLLLAQPDLIPVLMQKPFAVERFPAPYHPYLFYLSQDPREFSLWKNLLSSLPFGADQTAALPQARQNPPVIYSRTGIPIRKSV